MQEQRHCHTSRDAYAGEQEDRGRRQRYKGPVASVVIVLFLSQCAVGRLSGAARHAELLLEPLSTRSRTQKRTTERRRPIMKTHANVRGRPTFSRCHSPSLRFLCLASIGLRLTDLSFELIITSHAISCTSSVCVYMHDRARSINTAYIPSIRLFIHPSIYHYRHTSIFTNINPTMHPSMHSPS